MKESGREVDRLPAREIAANCQAQRKRGQIDEAEMTARNGLQHYPSDEDLLREHALAATLRKDWPEAVTRWQAAVDCNRTAGEASYIELVRALRRVGNLDQAESVVNQALAKIPASLRLEIERAEIAVGRKNWEEAARRWQTIIKGRKGRAPTDAFVKLSRAHCAMGSYIGAEEAVAEGLSVYPNNSQLLAERAGIAARRGNPAETISRWATILEARPAEVPGHGFVQLSNALLQLGDFERAEAVASAGLAQFPADVQLLRQSAQCSTAAGRWAEAVHRWRNVLQSGHTGISIADYEKYGAAQRGRLREDPLSHAVILAEAAMARRGWRQAVERWRLLLRDYADSAPPRAHARLSLCYRRLGDLSTAELTTARAEASFPEDVTIGVEKAEIAMAKRSWAEATTLWASVLARFPEEAPVSARIALNACERALAGSLPTDPTFHRPQEWDDNAARAEALNYRHHGETIFLLGSGPSLLSLRADHVERLKSAVTIGVNRVQYRVPLTYFLSAYPSEILLAQRASPRTQLLHMRPAYAPPIDSGVIALKRQDYQDGETLPLAFEGPVPTIVTRSNVLLGALCLAAMMSPSKIILCGFEQRDAAHYYDRDPEVNYRILDDLLEIGASHESMFDIDHGYCTLQYLIRQHAMATEQGKFHPFGETYHHTKKAVALQDASRRLRNFISQLSNRGIDIVSAVKDSIVVDAGARFEPLDEVL